MSPTVADRPTESGPTCDRSGALAQRLMKGAEALIEFARPLSDRQWRTPVPGDGRLVGVIVHHVASVYPLEVHLAQTMAGGTPIVGVTWAMVHEMNAAHAIEFAGVTKEAALALLDGEQRGRRRRHPRVDRRPPRARRARVALRPDAELTCQFMLEDHAVRHSYHHLARLRAALAASCP